MIDVDAQFTDMKRFSEQVKAMGARGVRFAISRTTNALAFGIRRYYPRVIDKHMIIRNKGFIRGRFAVKRSRPRDSRAYVFSRMIKSPKGWAFTGWMEQQRGSGPKRKHYGTLLSRGKKESRSIRMRARLGKKFPHMSDMPGSSTNQQLATLLRTLREDMNSRGPFVAGDVGGMPWGLWTLGSLNKSYRDQEGYRHIQLLQEFDAPRTDPKRIDWAGQGAKAYIAQEDVKSIWMEAYAASWRNAKK